MHKEITYLTYATVKSLLIVGHSFSVDFLGL